jgi:hypothetical protein
MRLSSVGAKIAMTINVQGYEYIKPEGWAEVELKFGDDIDEAMKYALTEAEKVFDMAEKRCREKYYEIKNKN